MFANNVTDLAARHFRHTSLPALARILESVCEANDRNPPSFISKFHAACIPSLPILEYLTRFYEHSGSSDSAFVLAVIYIDRIQQHPDLKACSINIHRLLLTAILVATKFIDDRCYNNKYFARLGGVSLAEINSLELEFLFILGFNLNVEPPLYEKYARALQVLPIPSSTSPVITTATATATTTLSAPTVVPTPLGDIDMADTTDTEAHSSDEDWDMDDTMRVEEEEEEDQAFAKGVWKDASVGPFAVLPRDHSSNNNFIKQEYKDAGMRRFMDDDQTMFRQDCRSL